MNKAAALQAWQDFKQTRKKTPIVSQVADIEVARAFVEASKEIIEEREAKISELEAEIESLKSQLQEQKERNEYLQGQLTEQNIMDSEILQRENTELRNQLNFLNVDYRSEQWRPIAGFNGLYEVSNQGNVRARGEEMTRQIDKAGRPFVTLYKTKLTNYFVACLVADAFLPNPYNFTSVRHIDDNVSNVRLENLQWVKPTKH